MKKLFIIGILLVSFGFSELQAFNINDCLEETVINNLNSKNLLTFIKENDLIGKIQKVCSEDICSNLNMVTLEQDIKNFIKQNLNYLREKDNDLALEAELKGFKIDKVIMNSCG